MHINQLRKLRQLLITSSRQWKNDTNQSIGCADSLNNQNKNLGIVELILDLRKQTNVKPID